MTLCPDCKKKGDEVVLLPLPAEVPNYVSNLVVLRCPVCRAEWCSDLKLERLIQGMPVKPWELDPRFKDLKDIDERELQREMKKILIEQIEIAAQKIVYLVVDRARGRDS